MNKRLAALAFSSAIFAPAALAQQDFSKVEIKARHEPHQEQVT